MLREGVTHASESRTASRRIALSRWELASFAGIIVVFLIHSIYLEVPAEDSFITFRFARHLAEGNGLVWNRGEAPVEGYTNFSWLLLSALAIKAGLNVVLITQALGVLFSIIAIGVTYRFSRRILEMPAGYALVPCLLLAASGPFATWAASSMETNLFALLVLLGCYGIAGGVRFHSLRHLAAGQFMLLLATLTRPEGLLVFAVLAALGLVFTLGSGRVFPLRNYLAALLVFLLPFLVYFAWRYQYFGYLLPNTFYAKTGGGLFQVIRGAKYAILFVLLFLLPLSPVASVLIWEQEWEWSLRKRLHLKSIIAHVQRHIGIYVCALVSLGYTLYIVSVGGDYMAMFRFFVPILPPIYLVSGFFVYLLFKSVSAQPHKRNIAAALVAAAVGFTVLQSLPIEQQLFGKPWFMHGTYRGVQHERWHVARNTLAGEFFRDYKKSNDESLAVLGIGIIPYITDMKIHSFHGIVDPAIAHSPIRPPEEERIAGHEKVDFVSVIRKKPTYIMVDTGDLFPEPQPFPDYPDEIDAFVRENYELKSVWLKDRVNRESGYMMFLELKDSK